MIEVTSDITLREHEIDWDFVRASGPGGQKVNRSATAVQLRFDLANTQSLPAPVRRRLMRLAKNRISKDGILILEASEHRTQDRNRKQALEKLIDLERQAAKKPKKRIRTKPTRAANRRRLRDKRKQAKKKRFRRAPRLDE
jgi:ribosome-associated protein